MHKELVKSLEKVKSLELAQKHLEHVQQRLQVAVRELRALDKIVEKEHQQYEELEKAGLRKMFRNLLGKDEERLQQEKQDYLEAVLKYNQQHKEVEILEFEQKVLREKLADAPNIRKEHQRKLDFYGEQIARTDTPEGKLIRQTNQDLERRYRDLTEVNEAVKTGQEAERLTAKMLDHLKKSGWWGENHQRQSVVKKVSKKLAHIDKARKLLPTVNLLLHRFMADLSDVYDEPEKMFRFNASSFQHFSNSFYDSLITDYILRQRAENAIRMVAHTHDKLKASLQKLWHLRQAHEQLIQELNQMKKDTLIRTIQSSKD